MNQVISHFTAKEFKSLNKGKKTQDLLQKYAIFTLHKLSSQCHPQGLIWQECQAKDVVPHLGTSLQFLVFIYPILNE
jgi:hypothetical protein